jgi:hypothetical protein
LGQSTKESNLPILAYPAKLFFISPPHALLFSAGLVELVVLGVGRWAFAGVVGLGTLFFALLLASTPEVGLYVGVYPLAWLGAVGVAALVPIFLRAAGIGTAGPEMTRRARFLGGIFLFMFCGAAVNSRFLRFTATIALTFDHRVAFLDRRFGLDPAFTLGRFLQAFHWLLNFAFFAYHALLLGLISLIAVQSRRSFRLGFSMLLQFAVAGMVGGTLSLLLPVAGPRYAFPDMFPAVDPLRGPADMWPSVLPASARTGMPSLHTAWVVLLYLAARREHLLIRVLYALLVAGTLLHTLGAGEHYLLDLVVAIPLAVGVSLIDLDSVKDRDVWVRVAGLLACTAVWVFAIRFAAPVLDSGPWIIPGLSVVTVGVPLAARWRWDNRRIAWPGSYGYAADKSGLASASRLRSWGK